MIPFIFVFYSLIISVHNWLIAKTFLLYSITMDTMDNPMDTMEKCLLSIVIPMDMSIANPGLITNFTFTQSFHQSVGFNVNDFVTPYGSDGDY